jgi:hypothetical protein
MFQVKSESQIASINNMNTNYAINKQYYYCINESCTQPTQLIDVTSDDLKPLEPDSGKIIIVKQDTSTLIPKKSVKNIRKHKNKHIRKQHIKKCIYVSKDEFKNSLNEGGIERTKVNKVNISSAKK